MRLFFLLLAVIGSVRAQELPNAVDLKAAYCTRFVSATLSMLSDTGNVIPAGRTDLKKELDGQIERLTATHRRLRAYLVPRMLRLDPMALMAASNQAISDIDSAKKSMEKCPINELASCRTAEVEFVQEKNNSCSNLSWLPF